MTSAVFRTALSIEKDWAAHRTLRFRAFYRTARRRCLMIDWEDFDPSARDAEARFLERQSNSVYDAWQEASAEAVLAELGGNRTSQDRIRTALERVGSDSILIGGPPCQAYSLVGRARNRGIRGYRPERDRRHYLYEEYVGILKQTQPAAFVMENVKGILSARVRQEGVFTRIIDDLESSGYSVFPLDPQSDEAGLFNAADPYDFVIRSERYGIPQARHRVIVLGVRKDQVTRLEATGVDLRTWIPDIFRQAPAAVPLQQVLAGLPRIPSSVSRRANGNQSWLQALSNQGERIRRALKTTAALHAGDAEEFIRELDHALQEAERVANLRGGLYAASPPLEGPLREWLFTSPPFGIQNHEARSHMPADLGRYLFAACYAAVQGRSPKAPDFPAALAPNHANWGTGKFADRFRVQVPDSPATTITSHISKDGHYFIHPDAPQCRSLTVREAARIQTFPDDYVFFGNRTQQYVQVGNAVPPYLAKRIAAVVAILLSR